jgi:hypothetical protein
MESRTMCAMHGVHGSGERQKASMAKPTFIKFFGGGICIRWLDDQRHLTTCVLGKFLSLSALSTPLRLSPFVPL